MKIALLSNVTLDVLAGLLRPEHELWMPSGFGAWMETALAVPEALKAFRPEAVFLLLDASHASFAEADAARAVAALEAALPEATVIVPDLADLADETGAFHDARMWKLAAMPWSLRGLRAIQGEINRLLRAMRGARRKVLALDFDDTLWKGLVGVDGADGVEPFVEFQRGVRALRARGVLLVGLSKNNAADVEPVWRNPRMVLRREDFADLRIDWRDKADNLLRAARALNLAPEAFVFVDDNPSERAQMAARLPEVAVPEAPLSIRRIARLYFPRLRVTDEDRCKTEQYRAEARRRELAGALSLDDYLKSLEIRTEIHPMRVDEIPRVAQLAQKANQFNVCTRRHTAGDVARFAADPAHALFTLRAADRFGDQGLVAFVHAVAEAGDVWAIADWVMSCRAMNRRLEFTFERAVEDALKRRGAVRLRAVWRRSGRNEPVRDLFEQFGFAVTSQTPEEKHYERILV